MKTNYSIVLSCAEDRGWRLVNPIMLSVEHSVNNELSYGVYWVEMAIYGEGKTLQEAIECFVKQAVDELYDAEIDEINNTPRHHSLIIFVDKLKDFWKKYGK